MRVKNEVKQAEGHKSFLIFSSMSLIQNDSKNNNMSFTTSKNSIIFGKYLLSQFSIV